MNEDDTALQQGRNKTTVFTLEERKLLLKLVNLHYDVLNNKKVDAASTHLKNEAWTKIQKHYSETVAHVHRTPQQLKRCWENMKCKAKKGDPVSVKLLRWSEAQYKQLLNGENKELKYAESNDDSGFDPKLVSENNDKGDNQRIKIESQSKIDENLDHTFMKLTDLSESNECIHCECEKIEKSTKVQLLKLQKQQKDELHQLELQLTKDKIKHEKELYKLQVHEMTLKIENERRRAEILSKELNSNFS